MQSWRQIGCTRSLSRAESGIERSACSRLLLLLLKPICSAAVKPAAGKAAAPAVRAQCYFAVCARPTLRVQVLSGLSCGKRGRIKVRTHALVGRAFTLLVVSRGRACKSLRCLSCDHLVLRVPESRYVRVVARVIV